MKIYFTNFVEVAPDVAESVAGSQRNGRPEPTSRRAHEHVMALIVPPP